MKSTWLLALNERDATLETAGGKGANLALLARQGFPVPGGFVVTTRAYRAFVTANDLADFIPTAVRDLPADGPSALEAASRAIRARFAAGALPADLAAALLEAYAGLGGPPVAVRSSATAEDLPGMSFAGQQDTFLNVVGEDSLLEAVVRCWGSLWTARAISYRARQGLAHDDLALAVVVQEMVQSEASGVLFTANPLDGRRTEMVIEATLGLGEALVSGQVEPDHYLVEAASGRILAKTLGAKALSIRGQAGGGTAAQAEEAATRQALPDAAITNLARLGRRVADLLNAPQDIEWAWADGALHLLQARPITALFPVPAGMPPEPLQVMFSFGAVQGIVGPMTPLGRDAIQAIFAGAGGLFGYRLTAETQNALTTAGERLFVNVTGLVRHRIWRRLLRRAMPVLEPSVAQALEPLWDDPRLAATEESGPRTLRRILPFLARLPGRFVLSLLRPDAERERFQRKLEDFAVKVEGRMAVAATLIGRLDLLEEILDQAFCFLLPQFIPRFGLGMAMLNLLTHLAADLPAGEQDAGQPSALAMTRGLPHNVTTEMDLALWRTAQRIKSEATAVACFQQREPGDLAADYLAELLPGPAQAAVSDFLQRYGVRGLGEIDLGRPRWREDPTPVMQALQSYLQIEEADRAPDVAFERGAAAAEAAIEHLAEGLRRAKGGWLKAWLVRWAARRMRALAGLRESPKFWAVRLMGLVRGALLDSGQKLVAAGLLAEPDDLFFLHFGELEALATGEARDWRTLVSERRQVYAREQRRRQVPRLLLSDGQAVYEGLAAPAEAGEGVLIGSPVSPGMVEGVVHVVFDPHQAQLAPGEILVCHGTDPAWTPLFLVAGGLVMEVGGLMTHGSVVAREYGIPAVVGVSQATTRLRTGQRVRVDGTTGRVIVQQEDWT